MSPPGGTNGDGRHSGAQAKIIPLRPNVPGASPESNPPSQRPPNSSRHSDPHLPSVTEYADFSTLRHLTQGLGSTYSQGPFARIFTLTQLLTNPKIDGTIEAELVREGNHFKITQEGPEKEIRIRYSQETSSRGSSEKILKPVFELSYLPDGRVINIPSFDNAGNPTTEKTYELGKLRRAGEMNHLKVISFMEQRVEILGKGLKSFVRLSTPLVQLQPTFRDIASRSNWYENFAVVDGNLYTLRTQNLGSASFETTPSQNQITIYKQESGKSVEVLKISETGEINYSPANSVRRAPHPAQLDLLNKLISNIESAHTDPKDYQTRLEGQVKSLGPEIADNIQIPKVAHTAIKLGERPPTLGELGEPIIRIENGVEIIRRIRPFWPQYERWVNPTNSSETRYLRPKGVIRRAMAWELMRWWGNTLWHGTVNDVTKIQPKVGHMSLHMFPDGTTELKIFRDYKRILSNGETHWENGLYNVIRRRADGKSVNLGRVAKRLAAKDPALANLPRERQLFLADQKTAGQNDNFDIPRLQMVPELPIRELVTDIPSEQGKPGPKGPTTALGALEAIENLPEIRESGLRTRINAMVKGNPLGQATGLAKENFFEIQFPGATPESLVTISENTLKSEGGKKRVVIHMWHGDTVVSAVYDNGAHNPHEAARLNMSEVHRARQGHYRPWFRGWGFLKGTSMVRLSHYFLHGGAYMLGHYASLPLAQGYEKLFWTDAQRQAIGTPAPDLSLKGIAKESGNAFWLMMGSGFGQITMEGWFNYGGAFRKAWQESSRSNITFGQAWRSLSPRWHNEPPVRFRPIHRHAGLTRNFLVRATPLAAGLLAVEAKQNGWIISSPIWTLSFDNWRKSFSRVDWQRYHTNLLKIGAVSMISSGLWSWTSHRTELAMAKRLPGQAVKGLGGVLLRNRFLTNASKQIGGARLAMTYRASLLTILLEVAALRIWDSYDRKNALIAEEPNLRGDLSSAINRQNEILSRLENGEAVPPKQIFTARQEVQGAYQRYSSYLKILERNEKQGAPEAISFENNYGEAYENYQGLEMALAIQSDPISAQKLAQAKFRLQSRLGQLKRKENQWDSQLNGIYQKYDIPQASQDSDESLQEFLAKNIKRADGTSEGESQATSPVAVTSDEGMAIVEHLNWKITQDPEFITWDQSKQAQFILNEFSGYRIQESDGSTRAWNQAEASAFLTELDEENTKRVNSLQTPLTSPSGNVKSSSPKMAQMALEVEQAYRTRDQGNIHTGKIQANLANSLPGLKKQMEQYEAQFSKRLNRSMVHFIPFNEEAGPVIATQGAIQKPTQPQSLVIDS